MPHELARAIERGLYACDFTWVRHHCVLCAALPGLRRTSDAILIDAIHHLELDQMNVNRMRVRCEVVNPPHFGRSGRGILGECVHPQQWIGVAIGQNGSEHGLCRAEWLGIGGVAGQTEFLRLVPAAAVAGMFVHENGSGFGFIQRHVAGHGRGR